MPAHFSWSNFVDWTEFKVTLCHYGNHLTFIAVITVGVMSVIDEMWLLELVTFLALVRMLHLNVQLSNTKL